MQSAPLAWTFSPAKDVAPFATRNFQFHELRIDLLQLKIKGEYNFLPAVPLWERPLHNWPVKGQSCVPR